MPDKDNVVYASFLREAPIVKVQEQIIDLTSPIDSFLFEGAHLFWWTRKHVDKTKLTNGKLERILGQSTTRRNTNTIRRMAKKYL